MRGGESIKSIAMLACQNKVSNLDLLAKKRQWEQDKRGTLISADAS
jgi:hypothetical protein